MIPPVTAAPPIIKNIRVLISTILHTGSGLFCFLTGFECFNLLRSLTEGVDSTLCGVPKWTDAFGLVDEKIGGGGLVALFLRMLLTLEILEGSFC